MTNEHLTEENLQAMLLEEGQYDAAAAHLSGCPECQQQWEAYQKLLAGFQTIKTEAPTFNVTASVMDKIIELENRKERTTYLALYLGLSLAALSLLVLLYPYLHLIFLQFKAASRTENVFLLVIALGVTGYVLYDAFRKYQQKEMLIWQ